MERRLSTGSASWNQTVPPTLTDGQLLPRTGGALFSTRTSQAATSMRHTSSRCGSDGEPHLLDWRRCLHVQCQLFRQLRCQRKLARAQLPHPLAIGCGAPATCVVAAAVDTTLEQRQELVVSVLRSAQLVRAVDGTRAAPCQWDGGTTGVAGGQLSTPVSARVIGIVDEVERSASEWVHNSLCRDESDHLVDGTEPHTSRGASESMSRDHACETTLSRTRWP